MGAQTILWCKSVMPKDEVEKKPEKETKEMDDSFKEKGKEFVMLSKKGEEEEFYFAPTKKEAAGKKKVEKKDEGVSKPLKHNIETFALFDKLKINAPMSTDDLPSVLEQLEAQMVSYNEKVKVWEEKMADRRRREE